MTLEVCGDGRFEIIEKAKQAIIESTNIETSPEEMAVLDNILFRCWQMGWLDKYDNQPNADGDTISRRAAILAITGEPPEAHYPSWYAERIKALPSAEQVAGKLNNPCDSLLTDDSEECKEQKSKLDLISRQDAIEAFYEPKNGGTYAELNDGSEWYMTSKEIYAVLESLPSAPDSRQRGEWVRKYDGHINCYWYECDQCGEYRPRNQFGHEYNANFCPNCGARMYKGGEEE